MRDSLSGHTLFALVMMLRSTERRTLLLVEGPNDARLFSNIVDKDECLCLPGTGRASVLDAIAELNARGVAGVVCVIDADFSRIDGDVPDLEDVLVTDHHDIEITLLASDALQRVIDEWASPDKVQAHLEASGVGDVLSIVLTAAAPMGALRLHSHRENLGLNFDGLDISDFLDPSTLDLDQPRLISVVLQRSAQLRPGRVEETSAAVSGLLAEPNDPLQLCNGHDAVAVLAFSLRRALGSLNAAEGANRPIVSRVLRTAYTLADFRRTSLADQMREWEDANPPWRLLPAAA